MRILISYQYFLPAFRAGGPIQSISNLARFLSASGNEVYIFCSDKDLNNIQLDALSDNWIDFAPNTKVYYNSKNLSKKDTIALISQVNPDVLFINGLYSMTYTIYPLLYKSTKKILSARGMLHPGALSQKTFKKKVFLGLFRAFGLNKACSFHATTDEEVGYIKNNMGSGVKTWMVSNLPNLNDYQQPIEKIKGEVSIVSISLISPMKNIHLVIEALKQCNVNIAYHIYGPIKDNEYWQTCLNATAEFPPNITFKYKGEVEPKDVTKKLSKYHYFILPSKSENFGHAIYEALSAGRPVITSNNTPWNGLKNANAGYNVNPENIKELREALSDVADMSNEDYLQQSISSRSYVLEQYDIETIQSEYLKMFSSN